MKRIAKKLATVVTIIAFLCFAIIITDSELWLTIWLVLLIFVGVPLCLVSVADIVREIRGPEAETGFFSTGIHVTAVFACLVGYLLYRMADWTDHAFEDKHVYLPFIFVAVVYGYPLLMWLRAKAMDIFFDAVRTEDELGSHSGDPIERDANSGD